MKNKDKTKVELIKELKFLREEREKGIFKDITECKQVEEEIKGATVKWQTSFDAMNDAVSLIDNNGIVLQCNQSYLNLLGKTETEILGKRCWEIVHGTNKPIDGCPIVKMKKSFQRESLLLPIDDKWFNVVVDPVFDDDNNLISAVHIITDITERKQVEQALIESEEKYRTVFENTGTATIIIEEDKTISMVNTQSEKMYGYSKEEIENKMKWTDFVIPEDLERMKKYHIARRKAGEKAPTEYNFRLIDKKGNIKDIFLKIGMIPGTKKSVASLMDITERKQAEEKINHLNLVLRAIRNVNQLIVKEKNCERLLKGVCDNLIGTQSYYSAWIALLDKSGKLETYAEAGIGKAILPMVETLKKGESVVCSQKALKQQEVVTIKDPASTCTECPLAKQHSGQRAMTIRLEHNRKVYGLLSVSIPAYLADDQEEQDLFKEVAGDIAFSIHNIELDKERIQAEENVKNIKDELEILLDSVPAIIFYKDAEGKIIRANKALADSLKVPIKDIVGKTTEELFPREQAEKMRKDDKEVMISGIPKRNIIQPYDTPDGTRWLISGRGQARSYHIAGGNPVW